MIKRPTGNKRLGFTLIELLIVIGLIGVLAGSILTLINPLEQFARVRDAERKKTLRELANALERYMIKNRVYPYAGGWFSSEPGDFNIPNGPGNNEDWIPGLLASNEIKKLPRDPKGGTSTIIDGTCSSSPYKRAYLYKADQTFQGGSSCFKLMSHCAPESAGAFSNPTDPFLEPSRSTWAWMVCEPPGSACCVLGY